MPVGNLSDLFQYHLELAYDGEQRLAKELPKLVSAGSSAHLRNALEGYVEQSKVTSNGWIRFSRASKRSHSRRRIMPFGT